jgi:hypothetical protein
VASRYYSGSRRFGMVAWDVVVCPESMVVANLV